MNSKYAIGLLAALIIVVLIGGGYFFLNSSKSNPNSSNPQTQSEQNNSEISTQPSQEPTVSEAANEKTVSIELTASGFNPQSIEITTGTKVIWTNKSGKAATVDSNPHPAHTSLPEANLGSFNEGESLEFIFSKPLTYRYHNHFNASQGGTITVK